MKTKKSKGSAKSKNTSTKKQTKKQKSASTKKDKKKRTKGSVVKTETKIKPTVAQLRVEQSGQALVEYTKNNKVIKRVKSKFVKNKRLLSLKQDFVKELETYLRSPVVIPKKLDVTRKKSVEVIQENLSEVDAWQSRVALIQFEIAKVRQILNRLEVLIYTELLNGGFITTSTTGPKQKALVGSACGSLLIAQTVWTDYEILCGIVSSRLSESKRTVQMLTKLDDNARWAGKLSP